MIAVIKNFKEVIEHKDIDRMSKELYEFLTLYCGFIAHYNIKASRPPTRTQKPSQRYSSGTSTRTTCTTTVSTPATYRLTRIPG